jgi:hydrogenase large subunit
VLLLKRINFSPVTRLSGLLSVEVLVEKNVIIDAKVKGNQFRGFEWMLVGRNINDAPYFTERICGICSFAHGTASSYLLDDIFEDDIPEQAYILRNIMLALEFLQNHIRHFYIFSLPDFITLPQGIQYQGETVDRRFDERTNRRLIDSYLSAFSIAAKAHEGQTVFAGKAPHQHGIVHGGATVSPTADKIMHVKNIIHDLIEFIKERLLPDTELLERFYGDYYYMGISSSHFLSHGLFRKDKKGNTLWPGGVLTNNRYMPKIDFNSIKEGFWCKNPLF